MKFRTFGIVAGILAIFISLGVYFLVYKKVAKSGEAKAIMSTAMKTYQNAKRAASDEKRLYAIGQDAEATILKVHETGFATKEYTQLELLLKVMPTDGKPFQVKRTEMISISHAFLFQPGAKLKVKYDPAKPGQIALVSSPVPASAGSKKPTQRIEELEKLRKKGLINQDEYKKKREEILNSL